MTNPSAANTAQAPPIALALDTPDLERAVGWLQAASTSLSHAKVGLEMFCAYGPRALNAVVDASGLGLFCDLKLHDIPTTVSRAASALAPAAPQFLTVHAAGGADMIDAAAQALPDTRITAVTVLTSLSAADLDRLGIVGPPTEAVTRLAMVAVQAGARALVCSPQEVAAVRVAVGPDIVLITPGVRPVGADAGDQARTATPEAALDAGADLLVIGRPITGAGDVGAAAAAIAAGIAGRGARK